MKHKILPILLAIIAGAAILTACASGKSAVDSGEVTNLVHPVGEGNFYTTDAAVSTEAEGSTADASAETTQQPTTQKPKKNKKQNTTQPTTQRTTQPSTRPTTNPNIPKDNIGPANVNPGISSIQARMMSIINSLELKSIAFNKTSLEIEVGQSETLELKFSPTDAPNKSCTYSTDSSNAAIKLSGTTFTVTGKNAGLCTLTVTSHNGHKAVCDITVKRADAPTTQATAATEAPSTAAQTTVAESEPEEPSDN